MSSSPISPDFSPPPHSGSRPGLGAVLAAMAHILLVLALAWGVSWHSRPPEGGEAELWSAVPQVAAPRAAAPEPTPPTPAQPPPEPKPAPPKPETPPPPTEQELRNAQIALEKAKREEQQLREQQQKKEAERQRLEKEREQEKAREREREKEKEKEKEKEREREKELEKQKREAEKKAEAEKKREAEKKAEAEQRKPKEQEEKTEKLRQKNLERLRGQVDGTGDPNSTGTAAQSSGPSAGYAGRIKARIKPNIVFTESINGNPETDVEVRLAADGHILSQRIIASSGVKEWDEAVLRAIQKTEVLPRDTDGKVPPVMVMTFRPRDMAP